VQAPDGGGCGGATWRTRYPPDEAACVGGTASLSGYLTSIPESDHPEDAFLGATDPRPGRQRKRDHFRDGHGAFLAGRGRGPALRTVSLQLATVTNRTAGRMARHARGEESNNRGTTQVGGMASLSGEMLRIAALNAITRRMPFWELPIPALADRGDVIIQGWPWCLSRWPRSRACVPSVIGNHVLMS
jgi:hypothetical protein